MASNLSSAIHILGAGPSGALTALALAQLGHPVDLVDPKSVDELKARSRAYALTHSSRRLLEKLGLWTELLPCLVPFQELDLRDAAVDRSVLFSLQDLDPSSQSHGAIGWILDHRPLMEALLERLRASEVVHLHLGTPPPEPHNDSLVIAADGPGSPARQAWGIKTWSHRYKQGCLTAKVVLRGVDSGKAYEMFRPEGPLAVLPLADGCFQVVWSAPMDRCLDRAALAKSAFLDQLAGVLPEGIEPDLLLDQPAAFPQQLMLARRLSSGRGVLVGEAAHRCHPVGGQGLNLCWRDVETLAALAQQPHSAQRKARRYARKRLLDVAFVSLATDLLVRLFSNRQPILLPVRSTALMLLHKLPLSRRLSLRAMTNGPLRILSPLPD